MHETPPFPTLPAADASSAPAATWAPAVHEELRLLAARLLLGERRHHTLQATALVHEAWLRLAGRADARDLPHERFLALAATSMRRILIDSARRRQAARRDAGRRVGLDEVPEPVDTSAAASEDTSDALHDAELLALDESLSELAEADAELARLVELRVFGGHGVEETAALLGTSPRTVKRRWRFARAWLAQAIRARTGEHS